MSESLPEFVAAWQAQRPKLWGDMHRDIDLFAPFWREGAEALARLPPKMLHYRCRIVPIRFSSFNHHWHG